MEENTTPLGSSIEEELLTSARRASRQSTRVLIVIQIFSILIAAMVWNSSKWNWTHSRIRNAQIAQFLVESKCADDHLWRDEDSDTKAQKMIACLRDREERALVYRDDDIKGAAEFLLDRRYGSTSLSDFRNRLEEFRFENVTTFPIPLSGVRVDVNGLGVVAGIGFVILLGWLYLSLKRERENLPIVLERLGEPGVDLLRMESFFNPEATSETEATGKQWRGHAVTITAVIFPAVLLSFIIANDIKTIDRGLYLNTGMTIFTTGVELATLALSVFLILVSLRERSAIDCWWRRHKIS